MNYMNSFPSLNNPSLELGGGNATSMTLMNACMTSNDRHIDRMNPTSLIGNASESIDPY